VAAQTARLRATLTRIDGVRVLEAQWTGPKGLDDALVAHTVIRWH
jgi:hypothetical protein